MSTLNVPSGHQIPRKGEYKPDPKTNRLPSTTRSGDDQNTFNSTLEKISKDARDGMGTFANVMLMRHSNITPSVVFSFERYVGETTYHKDVVEDNLDACMEDVVRSAYVNDISGVFCFTNDEENELHDKVLVLEYTVRGGDGSTYKYLRPDFDKIIVRSLYGLVASNKILIIVSIVTVPVVADRAIIRSYY